MELAAEKLRDVLRAPKLENSTALIMANKKDLAGALTTKQVWPRRRVSTR